MVWECTTLTTQSEQTGSLKHQGNATVTQITTTGLCNDMCERSQLNLETRSTDSQEVQIIVNVTYLPLK